MEYTLLFVDDELDFRELYQDYFSELGYKILTAKNGNEALDLCRLHMPKIIITDFNLKSDMDGIELVTEIRKFSPAAYIAICSACPSIDKEQINRLRAAFFEKGDRLMTDLHSFVVERERQTAKYVKKTEYPWF